ncbi:hypothetical protein P7C73_g2551, partial [Tremellales sp. Uapishka_1]
MPPDMPREDYAAPAMYTLSYLSRILKFLLYGVVGLTTVSLASFEGLHFYIEHSAMALPSRSSEPSDPYGWQEENQGWTGGSKGGTDRRLGWKARHALRGAWICQEWGAGSAPGAIGKASTSVHPSMGSRGMIGSKINKIDRGYELAEEYIDVAIAQAQKKGMVFPPVLSNLRQPGPPTEGEVEKTALPQGDATTIDLLCLKAGVLERISTPDALVQAKELYERVLIATTKQNGENRAKVMRLAGKIGDITARSGQSAEAVEWWIWGLARADVQLPSVSTVVKEEIKGWFSRSKASDNKDTSVIATAPRIDLHLPPPILRATISLLISTSAHLATTSNLHLASAIQSLALSLLPPTTRIPSPTSSTASQTLHTTWLQQRSSLLNLHHSSVTHALSPTSTRPVELATQASKESEAILPSILPLPSAYSAPSNPLSLPSRHLQRDTILTAAEASYTRGLLLEKSAKNNLDHLELAVECFDRAMELSILESGASKSKDGELEEGTGRGEEFGKYWRSFARVKSKLEVVTAA